MNDFFEYVDSNDYNPADWDLSDGKFDTGGGTNQMDLFTAMRFKPDLFKKFHNSPDWPTAYWLF